MRLRITAENAWYVPGGIVEVDEARAAQLLASGCAEPAPEVRTATKPTGAKAVKPAPRKRRKE